MEQTNYTAEKRKWQQIDEHERYKIEALFAQGARPAQIGLLLSRDRRTIEREIKRGLVEQKRQNPSNNKNSPLYIVEKVYKADFAQSRHDERASRKGRGLKIGSDRELADYIEYKIKNDKWSPDAIIGRIKRDDIKFKTTICTKTVYNYVDSGVFLGVTNKDLWVKKAHKKRDYKKIRKVALNNKNGKSITERPKIADDREEIGHWEIDLVVGKQGTRPAVMTLVDRKSRKSHYVLIRNKTQGEVIAALQRLKKRIGGDFSEVFKTITADNGSEFLDGEAMKNAVKCGDVYYAHPYSSWERGSNENGNRVLRRFFPKGTNFGGLTKRKLQEIEDWVNNYPRRILGYATASEVFAA